MDNVLLYLSLGLFVTMVLVAVTIYRVVGSPEQRRLRARLRKLRSDVQAADLPDAMLLQHHRIRTTSWLDAALSQLEAYRKLRILLVQGGSRARPEVFCLVMLMLAAGGVLVPTLLFGFQPAFLTGVCLGAAPVLDARRRKVQRVKKFERMFPDALDILNGALRAGMAFSGAIQVVSEECADPVAKEFSILFDESRLGIAMRQALQNLGERVDSKELHLFVTAVQLQRETGGNLTEILEQTAAVIRDRLRILGDVRAMTAQARLSGLILSILPLGLGAFIMATTPDYMTNMLKEPLGRYMLVTAAVLQVVGFFIMRKIADIRV